MLKMLSRTLSVLLLFASLLHCSSQFKLDLKLIFKAIRKPILEMWPLSVNFSSIHQLKVFDLEAKSGVAIDGYHTRYQIHRILEKAVNGKNISVLILGGSSSAGADLGCQNRRCVYHYALEMWWNRVISPHTGSFMHRKVIAIGGVGTEYISHCWKEYISQGEEFDLVLSEFGINDPDGENHQISVERLVRTVIRHASKPSLIFSNFFLRSRFSALNFSHIQVSCDDTNMKHLHDQASVALYYNLTAISLWKLVCTYNRQHPRGLMIEEMFIQHHPSHLAHAQMAYIIINYIKRNALHSLEMYQQNKLRTKSLLIPRAMNEANGRSPKTVCWTAVFPYANMFSSHSLFRLQVSSFHRFVSVKRPKWKAATAERTDIRGGYRGYYNNSYIKLTIPIPQVDARNKRDINIATSPIAHSGLARFTLTHKKLQESVVVDRNCGKALHKAQCVFAMGAVSVGEAILKVECLTGAVFLNAVIVV